MAEVDSRKFQKELNAGVISLVALAVLEQTGRSLYGYEFAQVLQQHAGEDLPMNQGAIYPVLRSLEKRGFLSSETRPSDSGPPRKYYALTADGKQALELWKQVWSKSKSFVESVLRGADHAAIASSDRTVSRRTRTNS